ncbi:cholinesterase 1-like [Physella acuta]|uniref:cholinesterase 1-like n=1 Tax=Physella acuta TaxID=109671 RepID=UPI0027DB29BC|nr:cholinesterase 1-like [Physella acuta]
MARILALVVFLFHCIHPNQGQQYVKSETSNQTPTEFIGQSTIAAFDKVQYHVAVFRGIPFAKPLSGDQRFSKPQTLELKNETYDALNFKNICFQKPDDADKCRTGFTQSEDCLYLNIYVPLKVNNNADNSNANITLSNNKTENLAVYIYIHGGAYFEGNGNCYDMGIFSGFGNIIVVTINYRLGAFGFLSTDDDVIPGNLGLWDQHEAIKWVSEHISAFGGDPGRITVGGQSAGSYSSILQALYPGNGGLFQRVIAQSGTPAAKNSVSRVAYNTSLHVAKLLGCDVDGPNQSSKIKQCLLGVNASRLAEVSPHVLAPSTLPFEPSLGGAFIANDPSLIFSSNSNPDAIPAHFSNKDILIGVDAQDGEVAYRLWVLLFNISAATAFTTPMPKERFRELVYDYLSDNLNEDINKYKRIIDAVVERYTDWGDADNLTVVSNKAVEMLTDVFFVLPVRDTAIGHAHNKTTSRRRRDVVSAAGKTYVYKFVIPKSLSSRNTIWWVEGTEHASEIPYTMGNVGNNSDGVKLSKAFMTYWSNFIKTGNPNSNPDKTPATFAEWNQFTVADQKYLYLTNDPAMRANFGAETRHLWQDVVPSLKQLLVNQDSLVKPSPITCRSNRGSHSAISVFFLLSLLSLAVV